ncbi:MAG TPA: hypothetical protein VGH27_23295 [Streptosporangiaceae bacterium]|jgi:hypothetical protein
MDSWTIGADIGTMLTGLSVLIATIVWTRTQWHGWQARKATIRLRNWHGFISPNGIDTWYVRVAEQPDRPTARVILEAMDCDGTPNENQAESIRRIVTSDGMLSRSPTPEEHAFLKYLHKERGYGSGFRI